MSKSTLSVIKPTEPIDIIIRDSRPEDAAEIHRIYAFSVMNGTGTFDEIPPSLEEIAEKRTKLADQNLPFLVAEYRNNVVGFSYAAQFRPRSAYRYTLEDSVYVGPDVRGLGIGRALLEALIKRTRGLGYHQMIAVIGDSNNHGSIKAHAAAGFQFMGQLDNVGLKFGEWLDIVFMQYTLNEDKPVPDESEESSNAKAPI